MTNVLKGLAWAVAILATAWAGHVGALPKDITRTLVMLIPIFAVLTLTRCAANSAVEEDAGA